MAIIKKVPRLKVEIDLDGQNGNAYFLLGSASRYAVQLNLDKKLFWRI